MISAVVAIDEKRGMASGSGIPWHLPSDSKYFIDKIRTGIILMGYGTYPEVKRPFHGRTNYVATSREEQLRPGFEIVHDVNDFLNEATEDVWIIGGPGLLMDTMNRIDTFFITQIYADFNCTKFLPVLDPDFKLTEAQDKLTENGTTFQFQTWTRSA